MPMIFRFNASGLMRWQIAGKRRVALYLNYFCEARAPASSICFGICFVHPAAALTETSGHLSAVHSASHCNTCNIDFTTNFDHNVEVVFRPNPSVRPLI